MCFKAPSVHPQVLSLKHLPRKCGSTAVGNASAPGWSALQPGAAAAGKGGRKASWLTLSSMNMMPIQIFASRQKLGQPAHSGGQPGRILHVKLRLHPVAAKRARRAAAAREAPRTAPDWTGPDCGRPAAWPDQTRLPPASRSAVQPAAGLRPCHFRAPTVCKMAGRRRAIQEPRSKKSTLSNTTTRHAHSAFASLHLTSLRPRSAGDHLCPVSQIAVSQKPPNLAGP